MMLSSEISPECLLIKHSINKNEIGALCYSYSIYKDNLAIC